ncbi:hypothetical protein, partial [Streptomyces sp. NPDC003487]
MVVCGDDALAHRLAAELRGVYGEQVTLVVPSAHRTVRPPVVTTVYDREARALEEVRREIEAVLTVRQDAEKR